MYEHTQKQKKNREKRTFPKKMNFFTEQSADNVMLAQLSLLINNRKGAQLHQTIEVSNLINT